MMIASGRFRKSYNLLLGIFGYVIHRKIVGANGCTGKIKGLSSEVRFTATYAVVLTACQGVRIAKHGSVLKVLQIPNMLYIKRALRQ